MRWCVGLGIGSALKRLFQHRLNGRHLQWPTPSLLRARVLRAAKDGKQRRSPTPSTAWPRYGHTRK
eukprot:5633897-Alexandrium_andersonii.AAC.1